MKLTETQIEEIARDLISGLRCFYNFKNHEIKSINNKKFEGFDFYNEDYLEVELNEIKEIENNSNDYFEFKEISSKDSFKIMKEFLEKINDSNFYNKLKIALNKSNPFQNFMNLIDNSHYRNDWNLFKKNKFIQWVKDQIVES